MTGINTIPRVLCPESGDKVVAAAATPEVLVASSTMAVSVILQAKSTNTGNVSIGDSASQDIELVPGDSISITPPDGNRMDLADIYIDVAVNGEGINYFYFGG